MILRLLARRQIIHLNINHLTYYLKMKKLALLLFFVVSFLFEGIAQDKVIMTVNNTPVYFSEFVNVYTKNNKNPDTSKEALDEYMELFVNYKLKVAEAERLGMDTNQIFLKELNGYRRQLAKPYLTDSSFQKQLLKDAYERMLEEVKASHILIKIEGAGLPKDTLAAYNEAIRVIKQLKSGTAFDALASKYSDDPSVANNKGDLGFFTGLQMVYPFETAAFNTKVGEVYPTPVKTRFGYHVIKVTDRRKALGKVQAAHILIQDISGPKKIDNKNKAGEIYNEIKNGLDFATAAKRYSDDKSSAKNGGELPAFGSGKMVEEFEEVAFSLKEGEVSFPFRTSYGWHIVKLIKKMPVGSYDELETLLKRRVTRDERAKQTEQSFVDKLKKEYNFKSYSKNLKVLTKVIDNSVFEGTWKKPKKKMTKALCEWNGGKITQDDFLSHIENIQRKAPKEDMNFFVNHFYNDYLNNQLIAFEDSKLESKYPAFKALMKEYRDGILLFDLTNKMVWNKAVEDTLGLKKYFQNNRALFQWKERANARIFMSSNPKLLKKAAKKAKKTKNVEDVIAAFNKESDLTVRGKQELEERGDNEYLDAVEWKEGASEIKEKNGEYFVVYFDEVLAPMAKELSETKGAAISGYQTYLEKEWLAELRKRFIVEVNKDVLYSYKN